MKAFLGIVIALMLAGCASVPMASQADDHAAKTFTPPSGMANVYVARSGDAFGSAAVFDILVDGKIVTKLSAGTYFVIAVPPGQHVIAAKGFENTSTSTANVEAGHNYFWEVTAHAGAFSAEASIAPVILEPMGRLMVQQYPLARPSP